MTKWMIRMSIGLLLVMSMSISTHDIPLAAYHMYVEPAEIQLEMEFDKVDIDEAVEALYQSKPSFDLIKQYVVSHSRWSINDKNMELDICTFAMDKEHYKLSANFQVEGVEVRVIHIENTCLVEEVDGHSNIIYLYYGDQRRGFRLHEQRQSTTIEL